MATDGGLPAGKARQAVVVGCGPAGSLVAIYLARLGWKVSVYERRSDYPTRVAMGGIDQRAYDIFLGPRGLTAIRDAGAELGPDVGVVLEGVALHTGRTGKIHKTKFPTAMKVVNRDVLGHTLHEYGAKAFPSQIDYNFDHKLVGIDFEAKSATFEGPGAGEVVKRPYDLLVGADGIWSGVRRRMEEAGFVKVKQERKPGGSRMLGIIERLPGSEDDWDRYWHLWLGDAMGMSATPTPGGHYRVGFGADTDKDCTQILNLKSEERLQEIVRCKFPDLFAGRPMPEGLARNLVEQEAIHNGIETDCSAFHAGDAVVLVGDAAHAVLPTQGQGCNIALESCKVLAGLIAEHDGDLSKALPAFTGVRKPDTDAAAVFSRRPFLTRWQIIKAKAMFKLHRLMPYLVPEGVGSRVLKGELRYSDVARLERRENRRLAVLLAGLVGLAVVALKK